VSESNNNVWSVVYVAGSDWFDSKSVPHGAVAAVTYYSTALKRDRRMHVYTPPGYELNTTKYPVFYLLHGAGDSDDAWTSEGRAAFILDNLIAARKARPMIVVMPAGHTNGPMPGVGAPASPTPATPGSPDEFTQDFLQDVMPYVEKHYRALTDRQSRAIAGLSMGGGQTLNIAFSHLDQFAYVGVFSSGLIGGGGGRGRGAAPVPGAAPGAAPAPSSGAAPMTATGPMAAPSGVAPTAGPAVGATPAAPPTASMPAPFGAAWAQQNQVALDNAALKKGLKLLWFSTGKDDGLITTTRSTVDLLKQHGFNPQFTESPGAHTWINWRNYLVQFAPQLFQ
jgi:enterochelin esterase family protein